MNTRRLASGCDPTRKPKAERGYHVTMREKAVPRNRLGPPETGNLERGARLSSERPVLPDGAAWWFRVMGPARSLPSFEGAACGSGSTTRWGTSGSLAMGVADQR